MLFNFILNGMGYFSLFLGVLHGLYCLRYLKVCEVLFTDVVGWVFISLGVGF